MTDHAHDPCTLAHKRCFSPGMRITILYGTNPVTARVVSVDEYGTVIAADERGRGWHSLSATEAEERCTLDFSDPATVGCLVTMVREGYNCPWAFVEGDEAQGGWRVRGLRLPPPDGRRVHYFGYTEIEALRAARAGLDRPPQPQTDKSPPA